MDEWFPIETAPRDGSRFLANMHQEDEDHVDDTTVITYFQVTSGKFMVNGYYVDDLGGVLTEWTHLPKIGARQSPKNIIQYASFLEKRNAQLETVVNDILGRANFALRVGDDAGEALSGIQRCLGRYTRQTLPSVSPDIPSMPEGAKGCLYAWHDELSELPMWCWLDKNESVYVDIDQYPGPPTHRYYSSFLTHELLRLARKVNFLEGKDE